MSAKTIAEFGEIPTVNQAIVTHNVRLWRREQAQRRAGELAAATREAMRLFRNGKPLVRMSEAWPSNR